MPSKKSNELSFAQLCHQCQPSAFKFTSTEDVSPLSEIIGQDRAQHALTFGIDIKNHGYHIFALGPVGTGKTTTIHKFLKADAKDKPTPCDWLYINNFEYEDKPRLLKLPAGIGRTFKDDMDQLVENLKSDVPKAFEGKEYVQQQEMIEGEFQQKTKELFEALDKKAEERGFKLLQTPQGMAAIAVVDGEVLTPEQHDKLSDEKREEIEKHQEELTIELREIFKRIEQLQKEGKENLLELDRKIVGFAVNHLIQALEEKFVEHEEVIKFLNDVKKDILKNVSAFKQLKQIGQPAAPQDMLMGAKYGDQAPTFDEYRVNLIVDNTKTEGAPVILEKNPTGPNLVGRIEQEGWLGTLVTNFRMIKSGALHRANGGYLIIEALDLLQKPMAWSMLKRALKNKEIVIESLMEAYGGMITRTLDPEPVPLNLKVVLIGDEYLYYLLFQLDQEFKELFKVKADFETKMPWNEKTNEQYAQFISMVCREEKVKHFAPTGVVKVIEYASRAVSHQKKLTTKFGDLIDIIRQSSYWASQNGNKYVQEADVEKALEEKIYRSNRIETLIQEMIEEGTILIDTDGKVVGQINGLSVISLGDYAFGKPSKITARTFIGNGGIVNIEREVKLSGPIHDKGSMILTGYLGGKYATRVPLTFSASITFEQLYQGVEGDSASSTEIYALLSSLSGHPIRQDLAVTGSVNQLGEIQPIGGVNEKIEGFFHICEIKGLTGNQGVIIPRQNVDHLVLKKSVLDAVKSGKFHIYAVSTIDEGIEILTGIEAGKLKKDGTYPANTLNYAVQKSVEKFAEMTQQFAVPKTENKRQKTEKKK